MDTEEVLDVFLLLPSRYKSKRIMENDTLHLIHHFAQNGRQNLVDEVL